MKDFSFPEIVINGIRLTDGQAMTLFAAIQNYAMDMNKKNALGRDKVSESIRQGYLKCIAGINEALLK